MVSPIKIFANSRINLPVDATISYSPDLHPDSLTSSFDSRGNGPDVVQALLGFDFDRKKDGGGIWIGPAKFATGGIVERIFVTSTDGLHQYVSPSAPQRVTAAQIHSELYAEVDALLAEPAPIEMAEPAPSDRVATLMRIGFSQQADVKKHLDLRFKYLDQALVYKNLKSNQEMAIGYQMRYPNYKFINADRLYAVIEKYGLQLEEVGDFIGDIPDANVAEMGRFLEVSIHEEDLINSGPVLGNFFIAAPPDQFIKKQPVLTNWLLDDPIVLFPVRFGFLIVTAWGDEASDPDVINERNN